MHPLTRERLLYVSIALLATFAVVWFIVSLIARGGGG